MSFIGKRETYTRYTEAFLTAIRDDAFYDGGAGFNVSLHVGNPGTSGAANEYSGGSYSRQSNSFSAIASDSHERMNHYRSRTFSNSGDIVFDVAQDGSTITHIGFFKSTTFSGYYELPTPITLSIGGGSDTVTIPSGEFKFTILDGEENFSNENQSDVYFTDNFKYVIYDAADILSTDEIALYNGDPTYGPGLTWPAISEEFSTRVACNMDPATKASGEEYNNADITITVPDDGDRYLTHFMLAASDDSVYLYARLEDPLFFDSEEYNDLDIVIPAGALVQKIVLSEAEDIG